jgi:hypothetical protein
MISVPVYSDENGLPQISIYAEDEDGTFRRTQSEPLRLLRDDIKGISISQGDLVSNHYDRQDRNWQSPTVTFHYGRPQSFYQFLRDKVAHNRFFVFTKPQLSGHISKFSLHELQLKNSTSQRKISLLKEKYVEALELWPKEQLGPEEQLEARAEHENRTAAAAKTVSRQTARDSKPLTSVRTASETSRSPDSLRDQKNPNPPQVARQPRATATGTQRKNLIQEFDLTKSKQQKIASKPKKHHQHFYNRFIFTID